MPGARCSSNRIQRVFDNRRWHVIKAPRDGQPSRPNFIPSSSPDNEAFPYARSSASATQLDDNMLAPENVAVAATLLSPGQERGSLTTLCSHSRIGAVLTLEIRRIARKVRECRKCASLSQGDQG
jgi:hypothetical protein